MWIYLKVSRDLSTGLLLTLLRTYILVRYRVGIFDLSRGITIDIAGHPWVMSPRNVKVDVSI